MRLWRGWWWHLLIVPACIGYQVIVHTALVDTYAGSIRLALACIPLALLAYWVVRYAHHKGRWALVLLGIAIALYLVEKKGDLALPAANALTHSFLNLFMLWLFGRTLLRGREPLVTGFARRFHGTIPPYIETYTRRVTIAWCVFFIAQVVVSASLWIFASLHAWSLFVNLLSLPLIVLMFVAEYAYRVMRFRSYPHASIVSGIQMFADQRAQRRRPAAS